MKDVRTFGRRTKPFAFMLPPPAKAAYWFSTMADQVGGFTLTPPDWVPDFGNFQGNEDVRWMLWHGPNTAAQRYGWPYVDEHRRWDSNAWIVGDQPDQGPGTGLISGQAIPYVLPDAVPANANRWSLNVGTFTYARWAQHTAWQLIYSPGILPGGDHQADAKAQAAPYSEASGLSFNPDPFRAPEMNPWPSANPHAYPPGFAPQPSRKPVPYQIQKEANLIGDAVMFHENAEPSLNPPPAPAPAAQPYKGRVPPGKGMKERKSKAWRVFEAIGDAFGGATELMDIVDAMWDALPKEYRTYSYRNGYKIKPAWDRRWADVYLHFDKLDIDEALKNIYANQIEDYLLGKLGQGARLPGQMPGINKFAWQKTLPDQQDALKAEEQFYEGDEEALKEIRKQRRKEAAAKRAQEEEPRLTPGWFT